MSFGPDIQDLLEDIGTSFSIIRTTGTLSGEKCYPKLNKQVTKPFIREFFIEAMFSYNTASVSGDIIQFTNDSRNFIIISKSPRDFENQAYDNQCVLYKCNVSGEVKRHFGEVWNEQSYRQDQVYQTVKSNAYALLTEEIYGNYVDQDAAIGQLENKAMILYIPASSNVQPLDRYYINSTTYFKVEEIERYKHPGVLVCHLEADTR